MELETYSNLIGILMLVGITSSVYAHMQLDAMRFTYERLPYFLISMIVGIVSIVAMLYLNSYCKPTEPEPIPWEEQ